LWNEDKRNFKALEELGSGAAYHKRKWRALEAEETSKNALNFTYEIGKRNVEETRLVGR
jgi:hypothetical protein